MARLTTASSPTPTVLHVPLPSSREPRPVHPFSSSASLDPDHLLSDDIRSQFQQTLLKFDDVFKPDIPEYNGAAGPIQAHVNMGPVDPPNEKDAFPSIHEINLQSYKKISTNLRKQAFSRSPKILACQLNILTRPSSLKTIGRSRHRV